MTRTLPLVALLLLPTAARAQHAPPLPTAEPAEVGMSAEALAKVSATLERFVDAEKVAGAVVAVARRGRLVLFEAVGRQNAAGERPMRTDSILRFYSMTKPVTAVAAMMLVEEGKLGLDEPVGRYLPELAGRPVMTGDEEVPAEREPTVRDLLRHTAGLTYGAFGDTPVDRLYRKAGVLAPDGDLAGMVAKLGDVPLLHQPGSRFHYSVASDVLGRLVEVASGQPLDTFFAERIFQPLKMTDTAFAVAEAGRDRFADNFMPDPDGGLLVADDAAASSYLRPPKLLSGGGGLTSTAGDYLRFCQMLLGGGELDGVRLLKADTVRQMTRNQLPDAAYPVGMKGPGVGFGLGFSVIAEHADPVRVGEYGWGGMASTHFWIQPAEQLAVVVLSQRVPYSGQLEDAVKPLVYEALEDR